MNLNRTEAEALELGYGYAQGQKLKQPLELHVGQREGISRALMGQIACSVIIVAIMAVSYIGTNLKLYEITSEISALSNDYNALLSENQRASVELESKISLRSIENSAVATMGMGKADSYQVEYVNLSNCDTIEVPAEKIDPLIEKISALVKVFKEYIGL